MRGRSRSSQMSSLALRATVFKADPPHLETVYTSGCFFPLRWNVATWFAICPEFSDLHLETFYTSRDRSQPGQWPNWSGTALSCESSVHCPVTSTCNGVDVLGGSIWALLLCVCNVYGSVVCACLIVYCAVMCKLSSRACKRAVVEGYFSADFIFSAQSPELLELFVDLVVALVRSHRRSLSHEWMLWEMQSQWENLTVMRSFSVGIALVLWIFKRKEPMCTDMGKLGNLFVVLSTRTPP